jgi:hypothetical protein
MWTEARFPDGLRVSLPFDAARQLRQTTGYLRGLKPPPPAVPTPGDLQPLPLERRTEIGRFG